MIIEKFGQLVIFSVSCVLSLERINLLILLND